MIRYIRTLENRFFTWHQSLSTESRMTIDWIFAVGLGFIAFLGTIIVLAAAANGLKLIR